MVRKRDKKLSMKRHVVDTAQSMLTSKQPIWKAAQVGNRLQNEKGLNVTNAFVANVLSKDLHMRFKRVQRTSFQGNSDISVVKRQLFAKVVIDSLLEGKRLVCIDETKIVESDMRKRKWKQ